MILDQMHVPPVISLINYVSYTWIMKDQTLIKRCTRPIINNTSSGAHIMYNVSLHSLGKWWERWIPDICKSSDMKQNKVNDYNAFKLYHLRMCIFLAGCTFVVHGSPIFRVPCGYPLNPVYANLTWKCIRPMTAIYHPSVCLSVCIWLRYDISSTNSNICILVMMVFTNKRNAHADLYA